MKATGAQCENHPLQEMNTYCHTDKITVCPECVIDFHQGHKVDRLVNVVQGFKEEISAMTKKVSSYSSSFLFLSSVNHMLLDFVWKIDQKV